MPLRDAFPWRRKFRLDNFPPHMVDEGKYVHQAHYQNRPWGRRSAPQGPPITPAASHLVTSAAHVANIYWDGGTGSCNTLTNWSTASGATTPDPGSVAGATEDAIFKITTANTASDASGVEYFFDETSGNAGGSDSV